MILSLSVSVSCGYSISSLHTGGASRWGGLEVATFQSAYIGVPARYVIFRPSTRHPRPGQFSQVRKFSSLKMLVNYPYLRFSELS